MNRARPPIEDDDDKPLDPAVEKVRRKLVRFVAINLGILFVALLAVVAALVYKTRPTGPVAEEVVASSPGVIEAEIALPSGARIVSQSLSGNRVAINSELADGSRVIFLYDFGERRLVGRLAIKPE